MDIIQFDFSGRGEPDIAETVYDSLHGFLLSPCELSWAAPIFIPGHPCHDAYDQMRAAYDRLCLRLGKNSEDYDAEEMIGCLLKYSKYLALEMFRCGRTYQKLLDSDQ